MQLAASAFLVTATTILSAADDAQMRNLENRVTALEQRKSANGMINPNGRPQIKGGADLFFTADFIYWVGNESGLDFVVKNDCNTNYTSNARFKSPGFKWEPGFRVGLGYNLPHDGWDLYANWTWLISRADRNVSTTDGEVLYPTFLNINQIDSVCGSVGCANAKWKTHLNVIDLELGRQFFVSKWLTVRPHFGLRNAWAYQHFNLDYCGNFNTYHNNESCSNTCGCSLSSSSSDDSSDSCYHYIPNRRGSVYSDNSCKFWGLGLRGGLNTQWGLGCGFSLYGDLALSMLFGRFHVKQDENFHPQDEASLKTNDIVDKFTACRAVTDLAAGLRWDQNFDRDRFHFRLQAGWEQHLFFSQNQFHRVVDDFAPGITVVNQGDLSFNGLTIATRFDF